MCGFLEKRPKVRITSLSLVLALLLPYVLFASNHIPQAKAEEASKAQRGGGLYDTS